MDRCQIFHVANSKPNAFTWKWRHTDRDGQVTEAKDSYELYYECVCAARKKGFKPEIVCS